MTFDRRVTAASDRVALESLRGILERPEYTTGTPARLTAALANLAPAPDCPRDRQVNFGADLIVIDRRAGWAFVQTKLDGYCGWLHQAELTEKNLPPITHRVTNPATHIYSGPNIKQPEIHALSIGTRLSVDKIEDNFARLATGGYVPVQHISDQPASDPVVVAESLLGSPYLWGGNSHSGIDCSGLVQISLTECGIYCPGDSDLQRNSFPETSEIQRGDLLFWPGHVALAASADMMIHATAWKMAVIQERIPDAIARIDIAGDGPFLGANRPRFDPTARGFPNPRPPGIKG